MKIRYDFAASITIRLEEKKIYIFNLLATLIKIFMFCRMCIVFIYMHCRLFDDVPMRKCLFRWVLVRIYRIVMVVEVNSAASNRPKNLLQQ